PAAGIDGDDSNDYPAFAPKTDDRRAQFRHAWYDSIGGCAAAARTGGGASTIACELAALSSI
ncbi:hypothetical protein ACC702_39935, partial [Rhizobium ruizarguesonis]